MHADIHMIVGVEWLKCEINLIIVEKNFWKLQIMTEKSLKK